MAQLIYYYAECCYAECRYAKCRYNECRGAWIMPEGRTYVQSFNFVVKATRGQTLQLTNPPAMKIFETLRKVACIVSIL